MWTTCNRIYSNNLISMNTPKLIKLGLVQKSQNPSSWAYCNLGLIKPARWGSRERCVHIAVCVLLRLV